MNEATPWVGFTSAGTSDLWRLNEAEEEPAGRWVAFWESKLMHQFEHRYATYEGTSQQEKLDGAPKTFTKQADPIAHIITRYLIPQQEWNIHTERRQKYSSGTGGYRDISNATNERTMIAAIIPDAGFMQPLNGISHQSPSKLLRLVACLNSFVLDFACRQKTPGTHINVTTCKQLPVLSDDKYATLGCHFLNSGDDWFLQRALELTYTAWDLESFAKDCGWIGPPFRWDEKRRFLLRCELDAAFFNLYLPAEKGGEWRPVEGETPDDLALLKANFPTPRDAVIYIMDTFPIVRRKDEEENDGDYRTKRVILELYDAMQEAIRTGKPYQTRLDPPPADPRCCHPPRKEDRS
jgi:hypothetical protein